MKTLFRFLLPFCLSALFLGTSGCSDDNILELPPVNENPVSPTEPDVHGFTSITGLVMNPDGMPLEGVAVSSKYETVYTTANGVFHLSKADVLNGRTFVNASKSGYFDNAFAIGAPDGDDAETTMKFVLSPKQIEQINSAIQTEVNIGGSASVIFAANSFADENGNTYNGTVEVALAHRSPDEELFRLAMPGGDMAAVTSSGAEAMLISYGAVGVELYTPSGAPLQLREGQVAAVKMKVPANLLADAPPTVPLWHFDETTAKWMEEGTAILAGNEYRGDVRHFTWWNVDIPTDPRALVTGQVLDCNNEPVAGIAVDVGPLTVYTNDEGWYSSEVAVGLDFTIEVSSFDFVESNTIYVPSVAIGENLMLNPLYVGCPATISGVLTDCEGNAMPGTITATWLGGANFVTTTDGNFSIPVLANAGIEITGVLQDVLTATTTVTSIGGQDVPLTAPLTVACASTIIGAFTDCGGSPVAGTVTATWDGNSTDIITSDGTFSLLVPGGIDVELYFLSTDLFQASTNITTNYGLPTNLPAPIAACDELDCNLVSYLYNGQSQIFAGTDTAEVYHEGETVDYLENSVFAMLIAANIVPDGFVTLLLVQNSSWFCIIVPNVAGSYTVNNFIEGTGTSGVFLIYYDYSQNEHYIADSGDVTLNMAVGGEAYTAEFNNISNEYFSPLLPGLGIAPMSAGELSGTFCVEDN